jgi:hypothetical protein
MTGAGTMAWWLYSQILEKETSVLHYPLHAVGQ